MAGQTAKGVALFALFAFAATAVAVEEQRGLASQHAAATLEPTEEAYAAYPLAAEEISQAATGIEVADSFVGATALDVMPLTLEAGEDGAVQSTGILRAVRSLESFLMEQQRTLDEVFASSQQRCHDDAVALGEQVSLLRGAIEQKEAHLQSTHVLLNQPQQFVELNKRVLRNLEREYTLAQDALAQQEKLVGSQAESINTALATATEALEVLRASYAHRQELRVNPEATTAFLEVASATGPAGAEGSAAAPAQLTAVEAELAAEEALSRLAEQLKERHAALNRANAGLAHAEAVLHAAEKHAAEVTERARKLSSEVSGILGEVGALSGLSVEDTQRQVREAEVAAKKQIEIADRQVAEAKALVAEEKRNVKEAWTAVHVLEDALKAATESRAAVIASSDEQVHSLEVAMLAVIERLNAQNLQVQSQLTAARARHATIAARIKHEAPALRAAVRQLEEARAEQSSAVHSIEVRKAELEQQMEHVKQSFVRMAAHCEHEAAQYARQTESRTSERRQLRVLAQHLEVKLAAVSRTLAAAHAAHEVRTAHEDAKTSLLLASVKGDLELKAVTRNGASHVLAEGESGEVAGDMGSDDSLYARALREVEASHASTEEKVRAKARLAMEVKISIKDAAYGAIESALRMVQTLREDLKIKRDHAQGTALAVVKAERGLEEARSKEANARTVYTGAMDLVSPAQNETETLLNHLRSLVTIRVDSLAQDTRFDHTIGEIVLPTEVSASAREELANRLVREALDMAEYPVSEVPPPAMLRLPQYRNLRGLSEIPEEARFDLAVATARGAWVNFKDTTAKAQAAEESVKSAIVEAQAAALRYDQAVKQSKDAANVLEVTRAKYTSNVEMWKKLEAFARHLVHVDMPKLDEQINCPLGNESATCTPRHRDGEAAAKMLEDLRRKHALLLRQQQQLREVTHHVAVARATHAAKYASDEEATVVQAAADNAVEKAAAELEAINSQVEEARDYLTDVDAEELQRNPEAIPGLRAETVVKAAEAAALVSGDVSQNTERTVQELDARLDAAHERATEQDVAALEASTEAKRVELNAAREELRELREAADVTRLAANEAKEAGETAALRDAEKLAQEAEADARAAEERVSALEAEVNTMETRQETQVEEIEEVRIQEERAAEVAKEEEHAAMVAAVMEDKATILPALDTLSKVELEEQEAERITRLADLEAQQHAEATQA